MQLPVVHAFPILEVVVQMLHEVRQVGEGWKRKQGQSSGQRAKVRGTAGCAFRVHGLGVFAPRLTVPSVEHIRDEVVDERDLGFGNATGVPIEDGHDHGKTLPLLLVRLEHRTRHMLGTQHMLAGLKLSTF